MDPEWGSRVSAFCRALKRPKHLRCAGPRCERPLNFGVMPHREANRVRDGFAAGARLAAHRVSRGGTRRQPRPFRRNAFQQVIRSKLAGRLAPRYDPPAHRASRRRRLGPLTDEGGHYLRARTLERAVASRRLACSPRRLDRRQWAVACASGDSQPWRAH